ncbi:glycoside hydrolase family 88 protein [Bacillus mycoides]|uniref:Unsaturated chondroitin disaccharide hydrolase n=1 Tax=Bacillus mycoides TaxID=1405 RepID=A0A653W3R1_BACMY|nr:glycoside hydrolase family 88 protein [Bacillus mycoides]VXC13066.1 Unsaturated chondroitin disaccharide hydrolase [Bacillus mycoides]
MTRQITKEGMNMEVFKNKPIFNQEIFQQAINDAVAKINGNLNVFANKFPDSTTIQYTYPLNTTATNRDEVLTSEEGVNIGWTTSFWTGMLWLSYELTGDESYRNTLEQHIQSFKERAEKEIDCDTHDLGFLYSISCVAAYKLTGSEAAKSAALTAADLLMKRYVEVAGILQAWGDMDDPDQRGRMIIDCLMNLPLLYWASEVTGKSIYKDTAYTHAQNSLEYIVRDDATTYHTYYFDTETGEPKFGKTYQGYSDDSCWARGQAWGIYGFALSYLYTKDERFLEMSKTLANYFLNRSPEDSVVYWDLIFTDGSGEVKDSSSSAIAVCGLLELIKYLPNEEEKQYYSNAAHKILLSLYENYSSRNEQSVNALLMHGVYAKPFNVGVDEANLWGDYYYLEALARVTKDWNPYW